MATTPARLKTKISEELMTVYANMNGNSGVYAYLIKNDAICVQFNTGATYSYTYGSAGTENIEQMKSLARIGQGLNSFINRIVKKNYAAKHC